MLGDIDGDGDRDLFLGAYGTAAIFLNDGFGSYSLSTAPLPSGTATIEDAVFADVDGDGDLDLAIAENILRPNKLWLNDGTGVFVDGGNRMPSLAEYSTDVEAVDADADGDVDLIFANSFQQNRLYLNDGMGNFFDSTSGRFPSDGDATTLALGDVDADGDVDVVCGNATTPNRLYLNDGAGVFTEAPGAVPSSLNRQRDIALADIDGDGDLDAIDNRSIGHGIYINDGTGRFVDESAARIVQTARDGQGVAVGDLDADGDIDLVFLRSGSTNFNTLVYLNDGNGRFTDATTQWLPFDGEARRAVIADLDGDRDADLLVLRWYGVTLFTNLEAQLHLPRAPQTGAALALDIFRRPLGTAPNLGLVAFAPNAATTPILPGLGILRLDPATLITLPYVVLPSGSGSARVTLGVPANPGLVGLTLYFQGLVFDASAGRLTNALRTTVQ